MKPNVLQVRRQSLGTCQEEMSKPGCVGAPLLEIHNRFFKSTTYGETIKVHTDVEEWRGKVFSHRHRAMRGDELICERRETRALCVKLRDKGLKAAAVPEFIRSPVPSTFSSVGTDSNLSRRCRHNRHHRQAHPR